jgi:hypothetical protein
MVAETYRANGADELAAAALHTRRKQEDCWWPLMSHWEGQNASPINQAWARRANPAKRNCSFRQSIAHRLAPTGRIELLDSAFLASLNPTMTAAQHGADPNSFVVNAEGFVKAEQLHFRFMSGQMPISYSALQYRLHPNTLRWMNQTGISTARGGPRSGFTAARPCSWKTVKCPRLELIGGRPPRSAYSERGVCISCTTQLEQVQCVIVYRTQHFQVEVSHSTISGTLKAEG